MITTILAVIGGIVVGIIVFLLLIIFGIIIAAYAIEDPENTEDITGKYYEIGEYKLWSFDSMSGRYELIKTYDNGDYILGKSKDIKEEVIADAINYLKTHLHSREVQVMGENGRMIFDKLRDD
jgi:hypothetical protein